MARGPVTLTFEVGTEDVRKVVVGGDKLVLIGGPCVLEDEAVNHEVASTLSAICEELGIGYIFKASYDKGNRGVHTSYRGPMLERGLELLAEIRKEHSVPVLTDVHSEEEARRAAGVVDMLQIPAYLCMQTSLVTAAAETGKPVNVKKGQFLAPWNVEGIITKVTSCGNESLMLTERGTVFGYNYLVWDVRSLPIMRSFGRPVAIDATHIVRKPGLPSSSPQGGEPEYVPYIVRAAVAAGVDAIFLETHPCPRCARCDASSMIPLSRVKDVLEQAVRLDAVVRAYDESPWRRDEEGFVP